MKPRSAFLFTLLFLLPLSTFAQEDNTGNTYSFKRIRPEFTIRQTTAFYTSGPTITGGANINDWFTAGMGVGLRDSYYDHLPAEAYSYNADLYMRGYLHLDRKHICSLYLDVLGGWNHCYATTYTRHGIEAEQDRLKNVYGSNWCSATFEPGIRVRLYHDLQLFLGLSYTIGRHQAIGFHFGLGI